MSDDPREYARKVEQMIAEVEAQVTDIAKAWQIKVVTALVLNTPGPGNQWPNTPYVASGRLRGGWNWTDEAPPASASRREGGPYDESGEATAGKMTLAILSADLPAQAWAYNEVAYGWLVHEGKGGHEGIGPRPWVDIEAARSQVHLDAARRDVMARR